MTGPEHYREAERLLAAAERHNTEHPADMRIAEVTAYAAQVHATLALAAATAANDPDPQGRGQDEDIYDEWTDVIAPRSPEGGGGQ